MSHRSTHILLIACVSYLLSQMAGIHLHTSSDPDHGAPHVVHLEANDQPDGEHSTDVDSSLLDVGGGWWKFAAPLMTTIVLLLASIWIVCTFLPLTGCSYVTGRRHHFRPQLRAPPIFL